MSAEDDDGDKPFEPSQKKLDDARTKGDVPRSADITTAASYGGFLLAALAFGPVSLIGLGTTLKVFLDQADSISDSVFDGAAAPFGGGALLALSTDLAPWFAIPALLSLLSILAQRGMIFAPTKLEPKFSRINPIATLGNKFGRAGLFEFGKSLLKLCIYAVVLFIYLNNQLSRILGSVNLTVAQVTVEILQICIGLLLIVLAISLAIGTFDLVFQFFEHNRKNMMSRQELIDEHKESEGDPHVKQQRRQRAVEIAMNKMLSEVPKADVIIVNPTHYAVALKWDRKSSRAPVCIAKGVDEIAARIREIAATSAIPIHSDPPTARALFASVEVGAEIKRDHYRAVAAAIRFAENIRKKAAKR
jgi:flagellar biosynthesis protein FlhB